MRRRDHEALDEACPVNVLHPLEAYHACDEPENTYHEDEDPEEAYDPEDE